MALPSDPAFFMDENLLGMGKLLMRAGRHDVVYPGHADLPEVPLGTPDLEWMPTVATRGLVVMTRERRIRTRPVELAAYRDHGIRSVRIGGKRDLSPADQFELFVTHEARLRDRILALGPGPWALLLARDGIRELPLPPTQRE